MKRFFIIACIGLASVMAACEKTLPLNLPEEEKWGITLNAVATPDTTFRAYVTRSYPSTEEPQFHIPLTDENLTSDYYYFYRHCYLPSYTGKGEIPEDESSVSYLFYKNLKESTLADARVEAVVNGEATYPMRYDENLLCFTSEYRPSAGDHIEVRIDHGERGQTSARTVVPQAQKLEVLEASRDMQAPAMTESQKLYFQGHVRMKLRLTDPSGEKNYYQLRVKGKIPPPLLFVDSVNIYVESFQSSDLIFRDERLTTGWGGWDAYFSDVFDDSLFDGESYTFEIDSYLFGGEGKVDYEVSLQSITEDYYLYQKSLLLYRISQSDSFSEGVYIHTNNQGGWGILGGVCGEVHHIEIP